MRGPVDRIAAFVEDLIRNQRPRRFKASPEEVEALRAAAALRSARPGADLPDREFIDHICACISVTVGGVLAERRRYRSPLDIEVDNITRPGNAKILQCRPLRLRVEVRERIFP